MPDLPVCRFLPALLCFLLLDGPREDPPLVLVPWSQARDAPVIQEWLREQWQCPDLEVRQHLPTDPLPLVAQGLVLMGYEEAWLEQQGLSTELALVPVDAPSFAGGFAQPLCLESWTVGRAGPTRPDTADAGSWSDLDAPLAASRVHLRLPSRWSSELRVLEFLGHRKDLLGEDLSQLRWGSFDRGTLFSPGASWRSLFARVEAGDLVLAPVRELVFAARDGKDLEPLLLREGVVGLTLGVAVTRNTTEDWQQRVRDLAAADLPGFLCQELECEPLGHVTGPLPEWQERVAVRRVAAPPRSDGLRAALLRLYPVEGESAPGGLDEAWIQLFDMVTLVVCGGVLVFVAWLMRRKSL